MSQSTLSPAIPPPHYKPPVIPEGMTISEWNWQLIIADLPPRVQAMERTDQCRILTAKMQIEREDHMDGLESPAKQLLNEGSAIRGEKTLVRYGFAYRIEMDKDGLPEAVLEEMH